ncbi:N-6 DNA methylase [Phyllobacterium pellucidum]|uniref:N-6 DNA methylase n=1 Tax=Phyllobacterium pellucidum TaxID=2740464 RepID=UPI001D15D01A|nr:N-6 DNA methylase [Phyllobacterium sp. T1018]UGY08315.1 N-6 DNA methylase [Phyllobacterium sp. T1018]
MTSALFRSDATATLLTDLRRANTETAKKERLIQFLTKTFSTDAGAQQLISDMALGAERTISNIPRGSRDARGRADTQTETIIIEWEKDLVKTGAHAKQQLEEYLVGNWRSGQSYRFVLVTSDGIRWRRYAPDWISLQEQGASLRSIELKEVEKFDLSEDNLQEFPFFLDSILFGTQTRAATLSRIQADFGDTSVVFINSLNTLMGIAGEIEEQNELKVAFEQWRRFLSLAYGKFDSSPKMFLVHTYLSIFAKFIAYAVVTGRSIPDEATTKRVLNGDAFRSMNIERFVEDDFFHWVHSDTHFTQLRPVFREVARRIQEYDFTSVSEDILKGVYQELIDLDTRHALGEYYTPDWLCEKIVNALAIASTSKILDPACGSGSFLRAALAKLQIIDPEATAEKLASQVAGIDIHPLSVQIAKTTVLLALGKRIGSSKRPVVLQIFLANSLLVPRGTANLFESSFEVSVDNTQHTIDVTGLGGGETFDNLITLCDELVHRHAEPLDRTKFVSLIRRSVPADTATVLPGQLYDVYLAMKTAKDQGRDSIWKFILQNSYKPVFLMKKFDFVVGNPPWLTYADVGSAEYQRLLRMLADVYGVTPTKKNMPHLEIAAIFLAHSVNYFLNEGGGSIAFVLPRSFMTADQHHNTRAGRIEGVRVNRVWDLKDVKPLFRVPSCVLFAVREPSANSRPIPPAGVQGLRIAGNLPSHHLNYASAEPLIADNPQKWFYSTLTGDKGKRVRSAFTRTRIEGKTGANAYSRFKQGATIVPRNFYFLDIDQELPKDATLVDRTIAVKTAVASDAEAKKNWKGKILEGRIEGSLLFRTAIARNVLPFYLLSPLLVTLPVLVSNAGSQQRFVPAAPDVLFEMGLTNGSAWFDDAVKTFEKFKSEGYHKNEMTLLKRLNFQQGVTAQSPTARYLVLYTASGTDASAVLIDRNESDLPFVADHKTYWCEVRTIAEGHYVAAFLNSGYANEAIKDFQSQGLFGERDIHKLIVMLPLPVFNKANLAHARLAELGNACAGIATDFAAAQNWSSMDARSLGRARTAIRKRLAIELLEIDQVLAKINNEKSIITKEAKRKRKQTDAGPLFER